MNYLSLLGILLFVGIVYYFYRLNTSLANDLSTCNNNCANTTNLLTQQIQLCSDDNTKLKSQLQYSIDNINSLQAQITASASDSAQNQQLISTLKDQLTKLQSQLDSDAVKFSTDATQIKQLQDSITSYQASLAKLQSTCITSCPPTPTQWFLFDIRAPSYTDPKSGTVYPGTEYSYLKYVAGVVSVVVVSDFPNSGNYITINTNTLVRAPNATPNKYSNNILGDWVDSTGSTKVSVRLSSTTYGMVSITYNGTVHGDTYSTPYPPFVYGKAIIQPQEGMFVYAPTDKNRTYQFNNGMRYYMNSWNVYPYTDGNHAPAVPIPYAVLQLIPEGPNMN